MRPFRLVSLAAVAVLAAACSTGGGSPSWSFGAPASPAASAGTTAAPASAAPPTASEMPAASVAAPAPAMSDVPAASTDASATRITVSLSDMLKIEPAAMTVPAGKPVTFVVTNTGTVLHEFTLGDEAEQMAHDREMMANGGMSMPKDEPMAIGVQPGQTKELTVTFDAPGQTLAGCHVIGHYAAGMKAAITIE
jgi:uncharacterized cupredoxin-like copper-binding protein